MSFGLNAGPTFADVFERLNRLATEAGGRRPGPHWYVDVAAAMKGAYQQRLGTADDAEPEQQVCTSHISVCDAAGSMVSMATTLLFSMAGRVTLPSTGFFINNGVLWFDLRPGEANSIGGGKRPLTNMCAAIVEREGKPIIVAGGAGERRIMRPSRNS